MQNKLIIILIGVFFIYSCQKNSVNTNQNKEVSLKDSTVKIETKKTYNTQVSLTKEGKEFIKQWNDYFELNDFLDNYRNIDYKTSLFHSQQLLTLTNKLKDSLNLKKLNIPSFKSRINTIHSISLRLADMDSIPAITEQEVVAETSNLINSFDGLTIKINTLAQKEFLENELKDFDFLFLKKDSVNSNSKKIYTKKNLNTKSKKIKRIKPIKNKLNEKVPNDSN
jgi:hypothetical protein